MNFYDKRAFDQLNIPPTTDQKKIKKAYAALVKQFHPEEYPEEWKQIHEAYQYAMDYSKSNTSSPIESKKEFFQSLEETVSNGEESKEKPFQPLEEMISYGSETKEEPFQPLEETVSYDPELGEEPFQPLEDTVTYDIESKQEQERFQVDFANLLAGQEEYRQECIDRVVQRIMEMKDNSDGEQWLSLMKSDDFQAMRYEAQVLRELACFIGKAQFSWRYFDEISSVLRKMKEEIKDPSSGIADADILYELLREVSLRANTARRRYDDAHRIVYPTENPKKSIGERFRVGSSYAFIAAVVASLFFLSSNKQNTQPDYDQLLQDYQLEQNQESINEHLDMLKEFEPSKEVEPLENTEQLYEEMKREDQQFKEPIRDGIWHLNPQKSLNLPNFEGIQQNENTYTFSIDFGDKEAHNIIFRKTIFGWADKKLIVKRYAEEQGEESAIMLSEGDYNIIPNTYTQDEEYLEIMCENRGQDKWIYVIVMV